MAFYKNSNPFGLFIAFNFIVFRFSLMFLVTQASVVAIYSQVDDDGIIELVKNFASLIVIA